MAHKFLNEADEFFKNCETGKAEEALKYVAEGAVFRRTPSSQDAARLRTFPFQYFYQSQVNWMAGIANTTLAPCNYVLHSKTHNETDVTFFATFYGENNGPGLQFPPPSPHPLGGPTPEPTKQKA